MAQDKFVHRKNGVRVSGRFQHPEAQFEFVGPQAEDGVIEFACHLQRPPVRASRISLFGRL